MKSIRKLKNITSLLLIMAMIFFISTVAFASDYTIKYPTVEETPASISGTATIDSINSKKEDAPASSSNNSPLTALATLPTTAAKALDVTSSANTPYFTGSYTLNAGQAGYVKLSATQNFNASVYTTGTTDLYIEIYSNQACTNLVASDDDSGHGLNPMIYFYISSGQTFYIKVRGYSNSTSGDFTFVIHRGQPTSRSEKSDMFSTYNSTTYKQYNNCYTYALSYFVHPKTGNKFRINGQNPGEMAGSPITLSDLTDASTAKTKIEAALTKDFNYFGGSWAEINASDQPREGYFKVALVLSPGVDYHWYREIPNGQWGHKPSIDSARLTDASGYLIYQPQSSDRDFTPTYPNYTDFIAFYEFKIPAGASPTASIQETEQKTYPIKHDLTMDVVKSLPKGMSTEKAMEILGQPHRYFGSGMVGSVYKLVDGTEVTVYFNNQIIDQIRVYHDDGSYDIIMQ